MGTLQRLVVSFVFLGAAWGSDGDTWDYFDFLNWCTVSANVCCPLAGTGKQSPIDFVTGDAVCKPALLDPRLSFSGGYFNKMPGTLVNTGHNIQFNPSEDAPAAIITGGPLRCKEFKFAQFHIHWGQDADVGSEHTVDGASHSAEIHLVHYNTAYGSIGEAVSQPDGLAVMGFFYEDAGSSGAVDPLLDSINRLARDLRDDDDSVDVELALAQILCNVASLDSYYTYAGSLTTPPCAESVTWMVFSDTIMVNGEEAFSRFRRLRDLNGAPLVTGTPNGGNFRVTQPLDGRLVFTPCEA